MLISQQIKAARLSSSEKLVADYLMEHMNELSELTSTALAKKTYTSPATVIRLAQRLGFTGWAELRKALKKEREYLNGAFTEIDANYPFGPEDSQEQISSKMALLFRESVEDTLNLIENETLKKAVDLVEKSNRVVLFSVGDLSYLASRFVCQLERIGKNAQIHSIPGMHEHTAWQMKKGECALLISYSGETPMILESALALKERDIPMIALTSAGNNTLSSLAEISLFVSTREKMISKIYNFSSSLSIIFLLDVLYSCLFARNYEENHRYKTSIARQIETKRNVKNEIILED